MKYKEHEVIDDDIKLTMYDENVNFIFKFKKTDKILKIKEDVDYDYTDLELMLCE